MRKKNLRIWIGIAWLVTAVWFAGCGAGEPAGETASDKVQTEEGASDARTPDEEEVPAEEEPVRGEGADEPADTPEETAGGSEETFGEKSPEEESVEHEPIEEAKPELDEEVLGDPRSSYGLGSAAYLKGKNVLLSLFVTTPESSFDEEEQLQMLNKIEKAVTYIEAQAGDYGVPVEIVYDFTGYPDLKMEAATELLINENEDFVDRLDEEIARWQEDVLNYEEILAKYEAEGIATMIFVNNPGISYAIVYDGTDSEKETMILFARDYYAPGKEETETAYAHEILHVFGAHDLYKDAEFTAEVTDYVALTYPREIMYTVTQTGAQIERVISPITAYHLGWIDEADEISMFPQLLRE